MGAPVGGIVPRYAVHASLLLHLRRLFWRGARGIFADQDNCLDPQTDNNRIAQQPLAAHTTTTLVHAMVHTSPHYVPVLTVITVRRTDDHVLERLLVHRKDCSTIQTTLLARRPNKPLEQVHTSLVPYYCQVTGYLLLLVGKPISFERCPLRSFLLNSDLHGKKETTAPFFSRVKRIA